MNTRTMGVWYTLVFDRRCKGMNVGAYITLADALRARDRRNIYGGPRAYVARVSGHSLPSSNMEIVL